MIDKILYFLARALIASVQSLPLKSVARLGRACGALAYYLDARHRRVALRNLTMCFENEKSIAGIRALARENFRRLGESYACAIKTAAMTIEQLRPQVAGVPGIFTFLQNPPPVRIDVGALDPVQPTERRQRSFVLTRFAALHRSLPPGL